MKRTKDCYLDCLLAADATVETKAHWFLRQPLSIARWNADVAATVKSNTAVVANHGG